MVLGFGIIDSETYVRDEEGASNTRAGHLISMHSAKSLLTAWLMSTVWTP